MCNLLSSDYFGFPALSAYRGSTKTIGSVLPMHMHTFIDESIQVLSVRHPQKGTLELGFTIVVPPGRLGQFTKVVQFWPRLLVVNRLPRALVLEQNSTLRYSTASP